MLASALTPSPPTTQELDRALAAFATFPARLGQLPRGEPDAVLRARPGRPAADGWSALEVLAHLRASDDIVAPRVYQMLARDAPPLPAVDERGLAETVGDEGWPVAESLDAFVLRRAELVAALRRHVPAAFVRTGEHEPAGTVTRWRVVCGLVDHGAEHLTQLAATLAPRG